MSKDSDIALIFNARNQFNRSAKAKYGVLCAACRKREPKRNATVLLPGQRCYCGYVDPRTKLTFKQRDELRKADGAPADPEHGQEHK